MSKAITTPANEQDSELARERIQSYLDEPRMTLLLSGKITAPLGLATSKESRGTGKEAHQILPRMGADSPILPGSSLCGAIRRALADDICLATRKSGRAPFKSIFEFFTMRVGGVAGFSSGKPLYHECSLRSVNPFISLFGKASVSGRIGVASAVAMNGNAVVARERGFRADDIQRNPALIEMLSPEMIDEYKALRVGGANEGDARIALSALGISDDNKHPVTPAQKSDAIQKISHRFSEMVTRGNGKDDEASATEEDVGKGITNIQNPWGGYEYFIPDTVFSHQITLYGVTRTEAALAVGALYAFSKSPRLGGHLHHGLGCVDLDYRAVTVSSDPLVGGVLSGELHIRSNISAFEDESVALLPAFEATGELRALLDHYLELRESGFPGMDFGAGGEDDREAVSIRKGSKVGSKRKPVKDDSGDKA